MISGQTSSGPGQQNATEIIAQQSFPTQPAKPPFTDLLASIGNVEAMLASLESESKNTDETIRQLYAQEANFRSGTRATRSILSPSLTSASSSSRATPFSATFQGSSTTTISDSNVNANNASNKGSVRKKASDETIACSIAFHNSELARAHVNLLEKIPTEVLCVILGWVVEPIGEKMSAADDGDGLRIGNPLLYWHLNPDRPLLRLVCRMWDQTIVAMAREIHVKLGSDESMVKLLETEERRRAKPITLTRSTVLQGRIGGARLPHLSLAIRNAYSNSLNRRGEDLKRINPWSFPPSVSSLSVEGGLSRSSDPKEDITLSSSYSGISPRPGGGSFDATTKPPQYRMNDAQFGTMLDHWLRAASPEGLAKFSISRSVDFGLNGRLTHFVYVYPCDAVQPVWRDLFRYCSSCELYHRRITTKTYSRTLLMPELPDQIQDFTFEMDELKFQESRIETFEQNRHGLDRKDIRYAVTLWKANDLATAQSSTAHIWCGFDLAQDEVRSWWPANLTRLDLSKAVVTGSTFDVPSQLQELVIAYPLEPNEVVVTGGALSGLSVEEKQWYPESLSTLEIRGVPYHVSCIIHDEFESKIKSWMSYINKMLKMVPPQLEHLTISSFQVPEAESMATMKERVKKSLKTWIVRLLCPQRPRQAVFSVLQLYAPFIYVDDESDEDEDEEAEDDVAVLSSGEDSDSDSSMDYMESFLRRGELAADRLRRRRQQAQRQARPTVGQTRPLGQSTNSQGSQGAHAPLGSLSAAEEYDVTPVMLRQAVKNMKVLESLEVYVNYQHYRLCRANWKGNLSLSEPPAVITPPTLNNNNTSEEEERDGDPVDQDETHSRKKPKSILKQPTGAASGVSTPAGSPVDRKGKGRAHDDPKGKGRKFNFSPLQPDDTWDRSGIVVETGRQDKGKGVKRSRDDDNDAIDAQVPFLAVTTSVSGIGEGVGGKGPARTSLRYWDNSCCGERCLGWGRVHLD
ncbi:hypothetical protein BGZ96_011018 [Linnemannia gamsii]|uniref:F-box domain-containing protein n=1 Tax=Linnemannia gamsii TaxID=64522 RepID=A0ABQ7KCW2_9FUNG|nr:hypothetical protein BGZ96_011018 [Linnemannia gamsii]